MLLFSVNIHAGAWSAYSHRGPYWLVSTCSNDVPAGASPIATITGAGSVERPQDQVFRSQSVGSTCSGAAAGPRLSARIRTKRSSASSFAYSTVTSK